MVAFAKDVQSCHFPGMTIDLFRELVKNLSLRMVDHGAENEVIEFRGSLDTLLAFLKRFTPPGYLPEDRAEAAARLQGAALMGMRVSIDDSLEQTLVICGVMPWSPEVRFTFD